MSWVMLYEEWEETAKEHLAAGRSIEEVLALTWNSALSSAEWAIHDADPKTYPGREPTIKGSEDLQAGLKLAQSAVMSLKTKCVTS